MMSSCGNRHAFELLDSFSHEDNLVCLGYLMMLLSSSDSPSIIPRDICRATQIAVTILPKIKNASQVNAFSSLSSWVLPESHAWFPLMSSHEQLFVGTMYFSGLGVGKNLADAFCLFELSAASGHPISQHHLGICYERGMGVEKDLDEALRLYQLSANQGFASATYCIGRCYENGVKKDFVQASRLYRLAAYRGSSAAKFHLAICFKFGLGVNPNISEALRLFRQSSLDGYIGSHDMDPLCPPVLMAWRRIECIISMCERVSMYPATCASLSQICRLLLPFLEGFLSGRTAPPQSLKSMSTFLELLNETEHFLGLFQSFDSELINDWNFHLKFFVEFRRRIHVLSSPLGFGLEAHNFMNDCSTIQQDLYSLFRTLKNYPVTKCQTPKRLHFLQDQCSTLILEWEKSQRQIETLQRLTIKIPEDDCKKVVEVLTEKNHILEDLIHSPIQFPQQFALVDSLNDSFMKSIHGFDNNLLEPFSQDINRLHDTMKLLHQLSVLPLLSVDRFHQLYACIGRRSESEYVEKEESLRRETLNQLEVAISQVTLEEFPDGVRSSSTGHFSDLVVRGRVGNRALSIKVYHTTKASFSNEEIRSMENEVLLMSLFHHSSILQTYGYCKADLQTTYLLLESAPIGSLWSVLIDTDRTPSIPLSLSLGWISDILSALCYLHDKRIIHGDVRAENVMLSDGLICKLTNCGSTPLLPPQSSPRSESDLLYMAPEVRMDGRRSHRSDMYSCGLTSYQILERTHPPHCMARQHVLLYASSLSVLPLVGYFEGCLKETPVERMSSREALDLIRSTQESEEFIGDPRQCRGSPNYEEVQVTSKSLLYCQKPQDVTTDDSSSHPVPIHDLVLLSPITRLLTSPSSLSTHLCT